MHVHRSAPFAAAVSLLLGVFCCVSFSATAGQAQSLDGAWGPAAVAAEATVAAPLRLHSALAASPLHVLNSAEEGARAELDALIAWNSAGHRPLKNGFVRPLAEPLAVRLTPALAGQGAQTAFAGGFLAAAEPGWLAWGTHVRIAGAYRVRLRLSDVRLPAGSRLAVWTPGEEPQRFGLEMLSPHGDLWTPSVLGEALVFEVDVPVAALGGSARQGRPFGFDVRETLEIVDLSPQSSLFAKSATDSSCIVDATCQSDADLANIDAYKHAVAQLQFVVPGRGAFLCTGSLLNDQAHDSIPYLLTANHCISDQDTAASLEAFFDYDTATCNGPSPLERRLPRSDGATLLATGGATTSTDFAFLQLANLPGGRFFLGWNADAAALQDGTPLYRLSHPAPDGFLRALSYGQYVYDPTFRPCIGITAPRFLYSHAVTGASAGGSSGSALLLGNGQVVGQLRGGCGPDPTNFCDRANDDFDGAFAVTFQAVKQYLSPGGGGGGHPTKTAKGRITTLTRPARLISVLAGTKTLKISVPTTTVITRAGKTVGFNVVRIGQQVTVTYKVIDGVNVAQTMVIAQ